MATTRRAASEWVQKQIRTAHNRPTGSWFRIADSSQGDRGAATKNSGASWFGVAHNTTSGTGNNGRDEAAQKVPVYSDPRRNGGTASHLTSPQENAAKLEDGTKQPAGNGDWLQQRGPGWRRECALQQ